LVDAAATSSGLKTEPAPASASPVAAPLPANLPLAPNVQLPAAWPISTQRVTVGFLIVAMLLLSWHGYRSSRWAARPTTLLQGEVSFQLDLNRADTVQLMQLPGVGEALARRIDAYRQEHGGFRSLDELREVSGIGPATLERLRPFLYIGETAISPDELADRSVPTVTRQKPRSAVAATSKKAEALAKPVNINKASAEELQRLPGIGPALAARIVASRDVQAFQAVDDLRRVKGIGAKKLQNLRPYVLVEAASGMAKAGE
ncbi:MAG: ComEA family DNA-binding protein, partial [Candidatus Acidiferrum sp.]